MAGAGFMTFTDGQVLTAAQVNNYLMEQSVMVFATATARSTALPTPSEGMVTYRTDNNVIEYYDGTAWQPILDQDVIQAKGDLIVGTGDDAVARLAVGTNDQILIADSATATGLKWGPSPTSGALVLISTATVSSSLTVSFDNVFSSTYRNYFFLLDVSGAATDDMRIRFRASGSDNSTANYQTQAIVGTGTSLTTTRTSNATEFKNGYVTTAVRNFASGYIFAPNLSQITSIVSTTGPGSTGIEIEAQVRSQTFSTTTVFDGIKFYTTGAANMTGKVSIYGVTE